MLTVIPPYLSCLALEGPDSIPLLERIVTCRVDNLAIGKGKPGALLTPQGKVVSDFHLTRTKLGCDLVVHADAAAELEKRLKLFRLRADVDIALRSITPPPLNDLDRIKAALPVFGKDFNATEAFPTDINLDQRGGIDYSKGCFVGQEVVSRMKRRGKIRKRTVTLSANGLQKGETVQAGGKRLGTISSAVDTAALAVIRIDHLADVLARDNKIESNGRTVEISLPEWIKVEMEAFQNADT